MAQVRLIAAMIGAAVLGGCQGTGLPPVGGPVALASNELYQLGRQELESGNYGLAERHFRQAVEANADDGPSWVGLAAAYDNLGRFELADRAYEEATRVEGETLTLLNNRGYSLYLRGERARAVALLRRAQALYPDAPVLQNNIALTRRGERPTRGATP